MVQIFLKNRNMQQFLSIFENNISFATQNRNLTAYMIDVKCNTEKKSRYVK